MIDYHVHPGYSPDASGSIDDYCRQALAVGLGEVCFTTHLEPDPARSDRESVVVNGRHVQPLSEWAGRYLADIGRARERFPDLLIRAGVEVGYEPGLESLIAPYLDRHEFDYVLGAVHCLDHLALTASGEIGDFVKHFSAWPETVAARYHEHLCRAAESGLFDCLAHIDIYRKHLGPAMGDGFLKMCSDRFADTMGRIARTETGIEVNTSALRRGDAEPYPGRGLLALALRAGIRRFTVGSDAHRVGDVGTGVGQALKLLNELGTSVTRFDRRVARAAAGGIIGR